MNIGVIHGFVGGGGGTEKMLHVVLDMLEKSTHSTTLYTFSKPQKIKSNNVKIKTVLPFHFPFFGLYQRIAESRLVAKAKNDDILIQMSGGLGMPASGNQKIIVYCHTDFSSELDNPLTKYRGFWSLYYKSYFKLMKKFLNNISNPHICLVSNSKFVHDLIKSKYDKNSTVINPPVDLNEFSPTNKMNQVVSIGRFSEEKNLEFGIRTMAKLDCPYHVIGNTKTKSNTLYYERLNSTVKNSNLESKIHLSKNICREDLVAHLNVSKVYFHCSAETFGISVVEGIAAGCIPIVPDNSAHRETVPFKELRYKENDMLDAKDKIEKALSGEFDRYKTQLRDSIEKYTGEKFKKSLLLLVENLAKP